MKYLVIRKQKGEGCDYTIGCGMHYEWRDFDGTPAEALAHFSKKIAYPEGDDEYFALEDDSDLSEAWVIPADSAMRVDLAALRGEHRRKEKEQQARETERTERDLLTKLQKKYS